MRREAVLARAPKVLTRRQRDFYFENGYLLLEGFVSEAWLARLWEVTERKRAPAAPAGQVGV